MTPHPTLRQGQRQFAAGLAGERPALLDVLLRPLCGQAPRSSVYRHAYRARLCAALRSNYPVLHRVLGDDAFDALALAHLAQHPSGHPSIRWFGQALASHMHTLAQAGELPAALVDLARMEWALGLSFDAADATPLAPAALAALPAEAWPALRFAPHPSVQLLDLHWAVAPLWQALTLDPTADTAAPAAQAHSLLIWRAGLDSRWRSLPDDEAGLLRAALAGHTVAQLCEAAAAPHGAAAAAVVASALQRWMGAGLLVMPA
jgi:hypothetical protein